jgi:hypothetical protein
MRASIDIDMAHHLSTFGWFKTRFIHDRPPILDKAGAQLIVLRQAHQ